MDKKNIIIAGLLFIIILGFFASTIKIDKVAANEKNSKNKIDDQKIEIISNNQSDDETIEKYFTNVKNELEEYYANNKFESLKEKGTEYYQTLTNFLFYNGLINDITINDIKQETINEIYNTYLSIDEIIEKKYPDYKLELESKYYNISSFISDTYDNTVNNIINAIGIEEYNKLIKEKEKITSEAKSVYEKAKDKIDDWSK